MNDMKLTERLQLTASKIKRGSFPADIGTDHAYIPIYLVENGICKKVVATDVRKGPIERARKNVRLCGFAESILIKQGYGLSPIAEDDVDCAILAGMGGHLICSILEKGRDKANQIDYFVIQPMQFASIVRKYLYYNGYAIYDESLAKEGAKIYQVLSVEHGCDKIDDDIYFEIGKKLIEKKDPLLMDYIEYSMDQIRDIILKLEGCDSENSILRLKECSDKLKKYEEVRRWL
jgi:tRNA (adenine22-N1)-methyltransferase